MLRPVYVCASWLQIAGTVTMSTTDLDLDAKINIHPHLGRAILIVFIAFTIFFLTKAGIAFFLVLIPCVPLVYGLACGEQMRRMNEFTSLFCVWIVLLEWCGARTNFSRAH